MTAWLRQEPAFAAAGWTHGWTTAAGPDFRGDPAAAGHAAPVAALATAVGLAQAAWVRQVHGGAVLKADGPGCLGEADALWTDRPGLGLVGRAADCPLVLVGVAGPRPVWGFAHASWRATVRGITARLVAALAGAGGDPARASAVVCPSAGPCCYEVGGEVRDEACARLGPGAAAFFTRRGGRFVMDLWAANRAQLLAGGVPAAAVTVAGICTICTADYPSHRRQGAGAGRFAALIGPRGRAPTGTGP